MSKRKYSLSEVQRRLLCERYDSRPETIDALQIFFPGVPRWKVRQWARAEGMARTREQPWSEEDEEYLSRVLHRESWGAIARRLNRTVTAVKLKAKRLGIRRGEEGYTLRAICEALGVDHHKVHLWMEKGWLKGERRQSDRAWDMWYFSEAALRAFFIRHPDEIDPRALYRAGSWLWFIDILTPHGLGTLSDPQHKEI